MRCRNILLASWLFVLSCCFWSAAIAAPQVGWWWNPSESGRGFFVESQNGVTFIAAYLYDADGHATWLVAGGSNADPYNYSGSLYNLSDGQTLFGGYVKPENLTVAGQMSVHFDDDTHGTFTWPGGVVQIEREIFGAGDVQFQPYSGWWWNSSESGSGYSLELQGNNLFVVGFMYDDTGRPTWYFTAGPMSSPTTYHGDVVQFAGGQTMGGPYQPPGSNAKVATVDIEFVTLDSATITFSGTSSAAELLKKSSRTDQITREFNDVAAPGFPTFYVGSFEEDVDFSGAAAEISSFTGHITFTGKNVTWQLNRIDVPPPQVPGLHTSNYILLGGQFTIAVSGTWVVNVPPVLYVNCSLTGTGSAPVRYPFTAASDLMVDNRDPGHYELTFVDIQDQVPIATTISCPGAPQGFAPPFPTIPLSVQGIPGTVEPVLDEISDNIPLQSGPTPGGSYSIRGKYDFVGAEECDPDQNPICLRAGSKRAGGRLP